MMQQTQLCDSCPLASVWGEVLRPGGLELTQRAIQGTRLDQTSRVLDIACGKGTTALFLAEQYGSSVIGIDLSSNMINICQNKAKRESSTHKVSFILGNGEALPFADCIFDVVTCECSFTLLKGKVVAREMSRVLKPGGKVLITNLFRQEIVNGKMQGLSPLFCCLVSAEPLSEQVKFLQEAGFQNILTEDHSRELKELALQISLKVGGFKKLFTGTSEKSSALPARPVKYGYVLITGLKPWNR